MDPESYLRRSVSLLRCEAEPLHGFNVILLHPAAVGEHEAEVELSVDVPLRSREAEPLHGFDVILRYAVSVRVESDGRIEPERRDPT